MVTSRWRAISGQLFKTVLKLTIVNGLARRALLIVPLASGYFEKNKVLPRSSLGVTKVCLRCYHGLSSEFFERVTSLRKDGVKVSIAIGGWTDSKGELRHS